jgi:hypothetical protein
MHCDAIQMDCNQLVFAGFLVKFTATSVVMLQSLQALKKISQEHPTACLRAGALMAVLSYLDFFSTGVQVFNSLLSVLVNYRHVEMLKHCGLVRILIEALLIIVMFSASSIIYCCKYVQETSFRCS